MTAFFLVLLVFISAATGGFSQVTNPYPPYPDILTTWKSAPFATFYGAARNSPLLGVLRGQGSRLSAHMHKLQEWLAGISKDVKLRRDRADGSECTVRGQPWLGAVVVCLNNRNIDAISEECATRTNHDGKSSKALAFQ